MEQERHGATDASIARPPRVGVGRNLLGSILIVLTPFLWIATWVLVVTHDRSTAAEAAVALLMAIALPVDIVLCFSSRVSAVVVAVVTLALLLATVALAAAVWADRTRFVPDARTAGLPTTSSTAGGVPLRAA